MFYRYFGQFYNEGHFWGLPVCFFGGRNPLKILRESILETTIFTPRGVNRAGLDIIKIMLKQAEHEIFFCS